jgi:phospholipid-binding lipoprotein MlaA
MRSAKILGIIMLTALLASGCAARTSGEAVKAEPSEPVMVAQSDATASDAGGDLEYKEDLMSDLEDEEMQVEPIPDPLEPLNRFIFEVNDKLYFMFIRPAATAYSWAVPEGGREAVGNFFDNIRYPIRFVNCILQGKLDKAWIETQKFLVNTTGGMLGFVDLAQISDDKFKTTPEDLGQTFGYAEISHGLYLVLPVLGPSSLRDGVGKVGDHFLDPLTWLEPEEYSWGAKGLDALNDESLRLGDYEDLREAAIDPYTAVKDAYTQYRKGLVEDKADATAGESGEATGFTK